MSTTTKQTLREVMTNAWRAFRVTGKSFAECLKQSWMAAKLKKAMRVSKSVEFFYKKVDGSIRQAFGTLKDGVIGAVEGGRRTNPDVFVYWDNERAGWRCFKRVNLISVSL